VGVTGGAVGIRPGRRLGRTMRVWWFAIRPLVIAGLLGALVVYVAMGGVNRSSSSLPPQNAAVGFIDAVRVGDTSACSMTTQAGAIDVVHLLRAAGARVGPANGESSWWATCAAAVERSSAPVRATAMPPFLGITGLTADSNGGGSATQGSDDLEWSDSPGGTYATVLVRHHGSEGFLIDAIRLQRTCRACS
jgi:hypothetical protein